MSTSVTSSGNFTRGCTQPADFSKGILNLFRLKGRTAIVTGAGQGIGFAAAHALAEAGANVAITYRTSKVADKSAKELADKYGVKCQAYYLEIQDNAQVEATFHKIVADFNGRLDIVIANAGIPWSKGAMVDGPLDHYYDVMKTNIDGVFFCARVAAGYWRRQKEQQQQEGGNKLENYSGGSFVATSSMSGHIVNIPQLQSAYNASKAAVRHLCGSLAVEWAGFARANSISPGYMLTEISSFAPQEMHELWQSKTPLGREGHPSELAGGYLYLASDASTFTTGTDITIDGGYHLP